MKVRLLPQWPFVFADNLVRLIQANVRLPLIRQFVVRNLGSSKALLHLYVTVF